MPAAATRQTGTATAAGHHPAWRFKAHASKSMAASSQSAQRHAATVRDGFSGWRTAGGAWRDGMRSEEHTSELQSQSNLVCRLLLEKKKKGQALRAPRARGRP